MIKKRICSPLLFSLFLSVNGCKHHLENNPPLSDAGSDQTTQIGNEVTLDGSNSKDLDGDAINYRWSIRSAPKGNTATLSATDIISPTLIPDMAGIYLIELIVNDGQTDSPADSVAMTVNAISNQAPIANAGIDQTVQMGNAVTLDGSASYDPDGDEITYQWITPTEITLSDTNAKKPTFIISNEITPGSLVINLKVVDSKGETSDLDSVEIIVTPQNDPPVAKARAGSKTAIIGQPITLNGLESFDNNDDTLTYLWSIKEAPEGNTATLSDINAISPTFIPNREGAYLFDLIVNDGQDNSTIDKVLVMVTVIPNRSPIADAGMDRTVQIGNEVTLDGSASIDPDGDAITYRWSVRSAPKNSNANLSATDAISPTLTPDIAGVYVIELVINDGQTDSPVDIVVMTVNSKPNQPPIASAGIDQTVEVSKEITLDGSASLDSDGDTITYLWSIRRAPEGHNTTLSATNVISPTLTPDIAGVYVIELVVNDGQTNSAINVVVITAKSSQSPIANAGTDQTVQVDNEVTLNGSGSNDPDGDAITYLWSINTSPENSNASLSASNVISPTLIPDMAGDYVIELVVNDGQTDSPVDVVVITAKSNQPPIANAGIDQIVEIGTEVTLDGSSSYDPDGDEITYLWTAPAGVILSSTTTDKPTFTTIDPQGPFSLFQKLKIFTLSVTDSQGITSDPDSIEVSFKSKKSRPIAEIRIDQKQNRFAIDRPITLDGSNSYGSDGENITYQWLISDAPEGSTATLSDINAISPSFTPNVVEDYEITLIVNDGNRDSESNFININVKTSVVREVKTKLSSGENHNCRINGSGNLWCWGENNFGQLGDDTTENKSTKTKIGTTNDWNQISLGGNHGCGITTENSLWCWGDNSSGQLGDGTIENKFIPTAIDPDTDWTQISLGADHSCAIKADGSLWCWGNNGFGQLGNSANQDSLLPIVIGTNTDWAEISLGDNHSCGLKTNGTLWCWGNNEFGQLGDGTNNNASTPVAIGTDIYWTSISLGGNHSCGLKTFGTLWCWGDNSSGQLGNGTTDDKSIPTLIGTEIYWTQISLGKNHSCGVKKFRNSFSTIERYLWCWGNNDFGQLGDETAINKLKPTEVGNESLFISIIPLINLYGESPISLGGNHSCGIDRSGDPFCWGENIVSQLGNDDTGTTGPKDFPRPEMITIPSGNFLMGDETSPDGNTQGEGDDNEVPTHTVEINSFDIGKYEVTVVQFRQFVDATNYVTDAENNDGDVNGCATYDSNGNFDWQAETSWKNPNFAQTEDDPVVCVSWNDAQAYIKWLNEKTESNYRLATEAEWEYAARAETVTKYSFGNNESDLCTYGNVADQTAAGKFTNWTRIAECSDEYIFTAPVGQFSTNTFGLYDMHGNVREWTEDCWHDNYIGAPNDGIAWVTDCTNSRRVLRGGSWYNNPWGLRSANRISATPNTRWATLGFRLAHLAQPFTIFAGHFEFIDEKGIFFDKDN